MRARHIIASALAALILASSAFAQLGPKDGVGLTATELDRVKVGQPAPDFSLEDADRKAITLSNLRGKKSVVLVFYRGYW